MEKHSWSAGVHYLEVSLRMPPKLRDSISSETAAGYSSGQQLVVIWISSQSLSIGTSCEVVNHSGFVFQIGSLVGQTTGMTSDRHGGH